MYLLKNTYKTQTCSSVDGHKANTFNHHPGQEIKRCQQNESSPLTPSPPRPLLLVSGHPPIARLPFLSDLGTWNPGYKTLDCKWQKPPLSWLAFVLF